MAYERELKFHVQLNLRNARLLPVTRDGRDYSADFTVQSVGEPRLAPAKGRIRVGVSGSLMAQWQVPDAFVEVLLNALAVRYLVSRIRDNSLTATEDLQLTTYNALGVERPPVERMKPQSGPFPVEFSRWVPA